MFTEPLRFALFVRSKLTQSLRLFCNDGDGGHPGCGVEGLRGRRLSGPRPGWATPIKYPPPPPLPPLARWAPTHQEEKAFRLKKYFASYFTAIGWRNQDILNNISVWIDYEQKNPFRLPFHWLPEKSARNCRLCSSLFNSA